jgi:LysR family hydrogen peroxide-inducible transcriptional activator
MELGQLRSMVAVVDTGNFTRAAERLGITQPSLSQQIINLEKELGHKLFHRLGRRAVVTEAGAVFIERARRILFETESAAKELSDHPSLERRITIGSIPTVAPYLIPGLITRCRALHPNLQIDVREDFSPYLMRAVVEGELDLAIAALPLKDPRISIEPLLVEPLLLVVGKGHPLATQAKVNVADLAKERFVMLGSSSSLAAQVKAFCGDHHFEPRIGFRCAQVATVKAIVGIGAGVSILPRVAQSAEDERTLKYVPLQGAAPTRELAVFRHVQRYQSRGAEQFLAVLRQRVRELVP